MRFALFVLALLLIQPVTLLAREQGEVTVNPVCGMIVNRSGQTVMLTIDTQPQRVRSGDMVRHSENLKLAEGEKREICARGPFYEGQRLELTIRSLVPLFHCRTKIDRDIVIESSPLPAGGRKLSATCF